MVSHVDLAAHLADPAQATALFTWNNNIVASSPHQSAVRAALMRDDLFTVVTDIFMTDTAAYADYVLPAASFLEFDDLVFAYFHHTVSAQAAALDAPGEALPNQKIFRRLAAAMGFNEPELFETDENMIDRMLRQTTFAGNFDDLKAVGTAQLFATPRAQFADLTFKTPSGKIEIASDRFAAQGLPRVPTPHADALPANGRIRVLSPASLWLLNSSYGNDGRIARRLGAPAMLINPVEAARRGIGEGQAVTLSNETGSLSLRAKCTEDVPEGVALVHKGRWLDGSGSANVNVLNYGMKTDIGESSAVHGVEADLVAG
jgi:anaerobic selenocysteine-containing dehydrogenase